MTILKSVMMATVLLASGSSLAIAQNGLPTGGQRPVAGGANGGGWAVAGMVVVPQATVTAGMVVLPATATATDTSPTGAYTATIGLTGTTISTRPRTTEAAKLPKRRTALLSKSRR